MVISNVVPMCMTVIAVVIHFTFGFHVKVELMAATSKGRRTSGVTTTTTRFTTTTVTSTSSVVTTTSTAMGKCVKLCLQRGKVVGCSAEAREGDSQLTCEMLIVLSHLGDR